LYLVRFCYDVKPADRNQAIELIREEVRAARGRNLVARLLVPLTRGAGDAALEYHVELPRLDAMEDFRERVIDASPERTHEWMRNLSDLLIAPPTVMIYRVDATDGGAS
jgi:hypothetical protein